VSPADAYLAVLERYKAGGARLSALLDFAMSFDGPCTARHHASDWKTDESGGLLCPMCAVSAAMPSETKPLPPRWSRDPLLRNYAEGKIGWATYQECRVRGYAERRTEEFEESELGDE
jgi:hypothetical protein